MGLILHPELTRDPRVKSELLYFRMTPHFSLSMIWKKIQTSSHELVLIIQKSFVRAMLIGYFVTRALTLGSRINSGWRITPLKLCYFFNLHFFNVAF